MGFFGGKTKTQTERYSMDPIGQSKLIAKTWDLMDRPTTLYPGSFRAEMDPLQEEALGMREQYARGLGGILDPSMQAWQSMLTAPDVANNPYVQGMLEQQGNLMQRNLAEAMPGIQAGQLGVNQRLGGAGQGVAEGIATRGAMDTLARQAAATQMGAYQAGLGQQRYGLGAMPQMAQMGLMPADIISGVGGARRDEEQAGIDEERFRYDFAQEEPWRRVERAARIWDPLTRPYGKTTGETSEEMSTASMIGQGLGVASSIGGMFTGGFGGFPGFGGGLGGSSYAGPSSYGAALSTPSPYVGAPQSYYSPDEFNLRML